MSHQYSSRVTREHDEEDQVPANVRYSVETAAGIRFTVLEPATAKGATFNTPQLSEWRRQRGNGPE